MKLIIILVAVGLAGQAARAEETTLTTEEISELLVGHTVEGIHFGAHTRQYFAESGLTLWIKSGDAVPSEARYKIENNQYCSSWTGLWNEPDWGCFAVHHDQEQGLYYYVSEGFRAPFIVGEAFSLHAD
ncbi:hypothetical protein RA27_22440 [Ruegeria sp. ANG-R]|uniref:hypothetical protein n=1 Tax=Ruegeria sp. ANG-R TaxID=1577903 RepID=UPI00057D7CE7|nr:hypothetical protein [Ruegeria sp. ANG-R]KIC36102.1 hypothetical protein RA27_22440 [Ruegeria sp. ANG-R]